MRKFSIFFLIAAILPVSCSKQSAEFVRQISLGAVQKSVECEAAFGTCDFSVFADAYVSSKDTSPIMYEASILGEPGWLSFDGSRSTKVSKYGSGTLTLYYDSNNGARRAAKVVLYAEGRTDTLSVKQNGVFQQYIRLVGEYSAVPSEGGEYSARIETNIAPGFLKVKGSQGVESWNVQNNILTFTVGQSPSRDIRTITLSVFTIDGWGEEISGSISLLQAPGK